MKDCTFSIKKTKTHIKNYTLTVANPQFRKSVYFAAVIAP